MSEPGDGFGPTRLEQGSQAKVGAAPPAAGAQVGTAGAPLAPAAAGAPAATGAAVAAGASGPARPPAAPGPAGSTPAKAPNKTSARGGARGPRRARLQLRNVNAWTVFRFAAVLSVFLFLVWLIVVMLLFGLLSATGVISDINSSVTTINGPGSTGVINGGRVFLYAVVIGAVNAILLIALTTVGSVVYNLCADLVGGIEVTLSERDS